MNDSKKEPLFRIEICYWNEDEVLKGIKAYRVPSSLTNFGPMASRFDRANRSTGITCATLPPLWKHPTR